MEVVFLDVLGSCERQGRTILKAFQVRSSNSVEMLPVEGSVDTDVVDRFPQFAELMTVYLAAQFRACG
jgi:hypothetical protein